MDSAAYYSRMIRICLFLAVFSALEYSSTAYQFAIGGRDGWVLRPSEGYGHWAERLRFQVNDTLIFKYNKASDSVLVVTRNDYEQCNAANPIQKMDDGNSVFKLERSGPFFFITGNKSKCDQGQKLIVVVLAVRSPPPSPPGVLPSPPSSEPPAAAPPGGSSSGGSGGGGGGAQPHSRSFAVAGCSPNSAVMVMITSVVVSLGFGGGNLVF